ncbi:MAG: HEAT repeat domain-containing protein [Planctomycetia bacterium]
MDPLAPLEEPTSLSQARAWLRDGDPRKRMLAAKALGRQGASVAEAVPDLCAALQDADPMVRSMVASALGRIGEGRAVPALLACLADPVLPVRFWAVEALGRIGQAAPGLREALEGLARSDDLHLSAAARRALARLAPAVP